MGIDWLHGKKVETFGSRNTLIVCIYRKGEKTLFKMFHGIGKITIYEKIDESKHGCKICGKPYDRKANLIKHQSKIHGKPKRNER